MRAKTGKTAKTDPIELEVPKSEGSDPGAKNRKTRMREMETKKKRRNSYELQRLWRTRPDSNRGPRA